MIASNDRRAWRPQMGSIRLRHVYGRSVVCAVCGRYVLRPLFWGFVAECAKAGSVEVMGTV